MTLILKRLIEFESNEVIEQKIEKVISRRFRYFLYVYMISPMSLRLALRLCAVLVIFSINRRYFQTLVKRLFAGWRRYRKSGESRWKGHVSCVQPPLRAALWKCS